jgi:hypothetical protein
MTRYALDSKDKFWRAQAGNLFSVVAAAVDDLLKDYQAAQRDITAKSVAHRDYTATEYVLPSMFMKVD